MVTEKNVMEVLKECYDPEIPVNIVDLGLIYDLKIKNGNILVKMTLTSLGCPAAPMLQQQVTEKIKSLKGVKDVNVEIVWEPPWTPEKMSEAAKLQLGFS